MTKHKGKNKRPGSKHIDTKMSPRKQARKTRRKIATYIKKTRPAILAKNARQCDKEYHFKQSLQRL